MSDLRNPNIGPFSMIDAGLTKTRMEFNDPSEEERYQSFKERLMSELVAEWSADKTHFPLVSKDAK